MLIDLILNHPAFIKNYLQRHTSLLKDAKPGCYAIQQIADDKFILIFKSSKGKLQGIVFEIKNEKICYVQSMGKFSGCGLVYKLDSIDELLAMIAKEKSTPLTTPLNDVINGDEKLRQWINEEQSPLVTELVEIIRNVLKANEESGFEFRKYESKEALEHAADQLQYCTSLNDQMAVRLICNMVQDVLFYEGGEVEHNHLTINGFDLFNNKPARRENYSYDMIKDGEKLQALLPTVRQFLVDHQFVNAESLVESVVRVVKSYW